MDEVFSSNPQTAEVQEYLPFYSYRHGVLQDKNQTFWNSSRRPSVRRGDEGTDVFISLVDLSGRMKVPNVDTLSVRCTCTNRDLPSRLPFGSETGDFEPEGLAQIRRVVALRKPTQAMRPPTGKGAVWRLISHLSLNYLSLVEEGREALQEILHLYDFPTLLISRSRSPGITALTSDRHFGTGSFSEQESRSCAVTGGDGVRRRASSSAAACPLFASMRSGFWHVRTMNSFSSSSPGRRTEEGGLHDWRPRAGQADPVVEFTGTRWVSCSPASRMLRVLSSGAPADARLPQPGGGGNDWPIPAAWCSGSAPTSP